MSANRYDYKVVVVGDSGVGKTSIVHWFLFGTRALKTGSTIGGSFSIKEITVPGDQNYSDTTIKLNIWDTAGQERFRSLSKIYYKNTFGCLCIFDVTNRDSFNNLDYWIDNYIKNNNIDNHTIILVANKCDFDPSQWVISEKEIDNFAKKNNYDYFLTSSVNGQNITETFNKLASSIVRIRQDYPLMDLDDSHTIVDLTPVASTFGINNCGC